MQITRQTEYAIKTLIELAEVPYGQLISNKVISQRHEIPEEFLHKTVQILSRAGLVVTQRGVQGGVRLGRPLEDITIADVIEAMEGPLALNVCLSPGYQCSNLKTCQVRKILSSAQTAMLQELKKKSLADIVAEGKGEES
ncbi:MAG: Rrf2 family transcriptional regulator [Firmicutes bacterium HGW-Firmicutes-15]|nr:MAG: Rrf2 family transcriptional regulator [Firmicutes bacterium HGW-Firmicutes-15]